MWRRKGKRLVTVSTQSVVCSGGMDTTLCSLGLTRPLLLLCCYCCVTDDQLVEAAKKLTGDIEQVPPMYSALHHNVSAAAVLHSSC